MVSVTEVCVALWIRFSPKGSNRNNTGRTDRLGYLISCRHITMSHNPLHLQSVTLSKAEGMQIRIMLK